jgi:hypothetical protein
MEKTPNVQTSFAVFASRTDSSRGEDGLRGGERSTPNVQFKIA